MWIDILIPEATAAIVSFIMFLFSKNSEKKTSSPPNQAKKEVFLSFTKILIFYSLLAYWKQAGTW